MPAEESVSKATEEEVAEGAPEPEVPVGKVSMQEEVMAGLDPAVEQAQYDLTSKMTPYLDRHLICQLLHHLLHLGVYKEEDVSKVQLRLLSETCMIDFAIDKYKEVGEDVPDSLNERRAEVLEEVSSKRERVFRLLKMLEDPSEVERIRELKNAEGMSIEFDLSPDIVDDLLKYAKLQYDCGNYDLSSMLLRHYRTTLQQCIESETKLISCIWGSLACELLQKSDYDEAPELILKLDEHLENTKAPKRDVLLHRTWLLHWTLFAIFSTDKLDPKILDFFLNDKSLSIISLSCPHLFRYVSACFVLQKRLKNLAKETVWIINHESGNYSDPVTRFLLALYHEMDFDDAQRELQRCEYVCKGDYFLAPHWTEFQENARLHIFESYCRTHQCINIQMIASKLNMEAVEAELWIVKLIQNAKLDARIDSEKSRVVMTKAPPNVYQQVIEKTKNLAFRSTMLVSNLEKR